MGQFNLKKILAVLFLPAVSCATIRLQLGAPVDDAYVSFVFARNWSQGAGLVFNAGDRIEGYSNFLWVMILGAMNRFGGASIPCAAQTLGFVLGVVNVFLVFTISKFLFKDEKWAYAAALLTALDLRVAVWSVEGLETPLYLFFILMSLCLYIVQERKWLWAIPALGAALTRPEGAIVFAALAAHRLAVLIREKRFPKISDYVAAVVFCIPYTAYTLWRFVYFGGYIMPNTFYARGGAGPVIGALYVILELWRAWGPALILVAAMAIFGAIKSRRETSAIIVWIAIDLLVVVAVGGDWMPNARFLVPILPLIFIIICAGCARIEKRGLKIALFAAMIAAQIANLAVYESGSSFNKNWSRHQDDFYMPVARKLTELGAKGELTALSDIGYIAYYSGIRVVDTLGLVDRHLARMKGGPEWSSDLKYVMDRKPRFAVTMVRKYGKVELGHTAFDREALTSAEFLADYKLVATTSGYFATELSYDDFKRHDYSVEFRIWEIANDFFLPKNNRESNP